MQAVTLTADPGVVSSHQAGRHETAEMVGPSSLTGTGIQSPGEVPAPVREGSSDQEEGKADFKYGGLIGVAETYNKI